MSRGWRTFYGAAAGALLVFLVHPVSRPFFLTALSHWGTSQTFLRSDLILDNNPVLPAPPKSLLDASLWMQAGAQRLTNREEVDGDHLHMLIRVARYAAGQDPVDRAWFVGQDPDNAFWHQMEAVFYDAESKRPEFSLEQKKHLRNMVLDEWRFASNLSRWNDLQTTRLRDIQATLASESGSSAAWQYAAVYPLRSEVPALLIRSLARGLLMGLDMDRPESLLIRYETLMNGKLLQEGSRSLELGRIGSDMVEFAAYPKVMNRHFPKKTFYITRAYFHDKLVHLGLVQKDPDKRAMFLQYAAHANDMFNSNDGWLAFSQREDIGPRTQEMRAVSLLSISIPGSLIAISAFGGLLWALSALLKSRPQLLKIVEPPIAPALGIILAILLYRATELPLASIAVVACFGFLAFTPSHERSHAPEQLGPVFELTLFALSCVLAGLCIAFFVGVSTPGCQVLPELGVPREFYGGSTLLLGLSGIVLGLLLLAAPCWAMVQRIPTPSVVVLALRQFGRGLLLGCLALAILVTPICIIADKFLQVQLDRIVIDEFQYYQKND